MQHARSCEIKTIVEELESLVEFLEKTTSDHGLRTKVTFSRNIADVPNNMDEIKNIQLLLHNWMTSLRSLLRVETGRKIMNNQFKKSGHTV